MWWFCFSFDVLLWRWLFWGSDWLCVLHLSDGFNLYQPTSVLHEDGMGWEGEWGRGEHAMILPCHCTYYLVFQMCWSMIFPRWISDSEDDVRADRAETELKLNSVEDFLDGRYRFESTLLYWFDFDLFQLFWMFLLAVLNINSYLHGGGTRKGERTRRGGGVSLMHGRCTASQGWLWTDLMSIHSTLNTFVDSLNCIIQLKKRMIQSILMYYRIVSVDEWDYLQEE